MSISSFLDNFNKGFTFGMFSNIPMFSCFNNFGSLWGGSMFGFGSGFNGFGLNCFNFSSIWNCGAGFNLNLNVNTSIFNSSPTFTNSAFSGFWNNVSVPSSGQNIFSNSSFNGFWDNITSTNPQNLTATNDNTDKKVDNTSKYTSGATGTVTNFYTGSAEDLNKKLANRGVLKGKGAKFIEMQNKYGISASFLAAICIQESGGTSSLALNNNNVAGITQGSGWRKFSSVDDCIEYLASLLRKNYIDKGLTTISQIHQKYCPPKGDPKDKKGTNGGWGNAVAGIKTGIDKAVA